MEKIPPGGNRTPPASTNRAAREGLEDTLPPRTRDEVACAGKTQLLQHAVTGELHSADFTLDEDAASALDTPGLQDLTLAETQVGAGKPALFGGYRLIRRLGSGGMGTVFEAHQIEADRVVALKVLARHLAAKSGFVSRFQREAQVMAQLDHANILRCYDFGAVHGWHFLALEYVDGGSLEEMLRREGRLSLADAVHIALACARALQHAHQLNLVHRDVKPDNVLLTRDGQVKLADLGLAKSQDDSLNLTRIGAGVGTPLYMPPEQARGSRRVDARSDIFALGCMLYRMLTGKFPYQAESLVELIVAKEEDSFPRPWQHNPSIPDRLDRIVARMLAGDPKRRFPSCAELIKQLEALKLAGRKLSLQTG